MSDPTRINGSVFVWASVEIRAADQLLTGFTSLSFSDKLEKVLIYGLGKSHAPIGQSKGKYTPESGKCKGWTHAVQNLREILAAKASDGRSYGTQVFQVSANFVEGDLNPITVELEDCYWTSNSATIEEKPDGLEEEFEFQPTRIKRNGTTLYDSTQEG